MLLGLGRHPEFLHTQAMTELIPTYTSILNQMVSARIQIIIAVKVSEAVRNNGWDFFYESHCKPLSYFYISFSEKESNKRQMNRFRV